ncbi:MAG TPA: PEGA domain-containing protein [Candidatus Saccharimonadia bacterium]|nr:PEGA domain-containing protein [Candidatus Saccharimonadia bacterium]
MLRRILIISGYVFLTLLLVGLTVVLVAYGNDYSYDFSTHKIIQKGHVIIDSLPNNIHITADGHILTKKTPYQAAYKVGMHTFGLNLDGYWPWQKSLEVVAGQVSLVQYVILVPKNPPQIDLDTRVQIVAQAISEDHRHLAYVTGGPDAAVYTLGVGNDSPVKVYTPKAGTTTTPAEQLTDVAWSADASHLLITGTVGGQPEELLESASGGSAINLTQQYGFTFAGIQFSTSNWQQLYWIAPDGLRRLDVGSQTVSSVLASNVSQFWPIPNQVLYVQNTGTEQSLWSINGNNHSQQLIDALAASPTYAVAYSTFLGTDELAVVPSATGTGTLYTGTFGSTPIAKTIAHAVSGASFSPDGHLVAFSSSNLIVTYDLNQSELQNKLVDYTISGEPGQLLSLSWFDNYHMLLNRSGEMYWSEFDGANRVDLGPAYGDFAAYGTSDAKSIVTFRPLGSGVRILLLSLKP